MPSIELQSPDLGFVPDYQEKTENYSPSTAGFGMEGGRAQMTHDVTDAEVDGVAVDMLGYTKANPSNAALVRKCPKAHPRYPWLYCSRVAQIQGVGKSTGKAITGGIFEANPLPFSATWPLWRVTTEYEPRPYYVLPDEQIPTGTVTWYDEDGVTTVTENYASEWLRYTDYEITPKPELIISQPGQMSFYTASGLLPGGQSGGMTVAGIPFPGYLRMTVAQAEINLTWYQVPWSYLASPKSRLVSYAGKVNQFDWNGWLKGELLYLGCSAKKYTPVSPDFQDDYAAGSVARPARIVDITMRFLFTKRPGTDVPTPTSKNVIAAGHNLSPWLQTQKFYAVGSNSSTAAAPTGFDVAVPTYFSRSYDLLFSNPDR